MRHLVSADFILKWKVLLHHKKFPRPPPPPLIIVSSCTRDVAIKDGLGEGVSIWGFALNLAVFRWSVYFPTVFGFYNSRPKAII